MAQVSASSRSTASLRAARRASRPFCGAIECVIVESPVNFEFDGSIDREHAAAAWQWVTRDLAPDLIPPDFDESDPAAVNGLELRFPEIVSRAEHAIASAGNNAVAVRRLRSQLGGEDEWRKLPTVLNAIKCRGLLLKAQGFGRATNGMQDDATLSSALQAMPLGEPAVAALVLHAAVGQTANPTRLMTAAIRIAGSEHENGIVRAGLAPLVDAMLAHAQNQIHLLTQVGPFADIDLACRAIDRFHRLARAVNGHVELQQNGRWRMIMAWLTKTVSDRIEPRVREVLMNINMALRRGRDGSDRFDADQLLAALNGVYILAAVREARDSLALNALFDRTWTQVRQALDIHIERNLDALRASPDDAGTNQKLDAAIKMAELTSGAEYAEILRRAHETARRPKDEESETLRANL